MFAPVHRMLVKALPVAMTGVLLQVCALAQEQKQQIPAEIELAEKSAALEAAIDRIQELQVQLAAAEAKAQALTEGLVTANAESVEFSEAYQALRVKIEALGPELLEKGDSGIRSRLLSAVSDLALVKKENDQLTDQLLKVTETIIAYVGLDDETKRPELLAKLETELRASDQILGFRMDNGERKIRSLGAARVVSLKKDWGLAVLDAGSASGVKVGTPVEIIRGGRPVSTATIAYVREQISGAILTSTAGAQDPARIGDGIRLAPEQKFQN